MERAAGNRGETKIVEPTRAQRSIARRAAESRATVPHVELSAEVDVGDVSPASIVAACGRALRAHPRANAAYRDGRFELYSRVNVAVPVAAAESYLLATVFDADTKSESDVAAELAGFAERALTPPELSGATFSVWLAEHVSSVTPVVVPPHAAALGAGAAQVRPVVRDGAIVTGRQMTLTLACDHRILYGAEATAFLAAIAAGLASR